MKQKAKVNRIHNRKGVNYYDVDMVDNPNALVGLFAEFELEADE